MITYCMDFIHFVDLSTDTVMFDKDALQANISWNSVNMGGENETLNTSGYMNDINILFFQHTFQTESLM